MKVVSTDSAAAALSVAIAVTLMCTLLSRHYHYYCCPRAVTVSAVTLLTAVLLSQRCARFRCHNAVFVFAVTTPCLFSLSQRCVCFRCHKAVLVFAVTTMCLFFAVTTMCLFSLSQSFTPRRCQSSAGFRLCTYHFKQSVFQASDYVTYVVSRQVFTGNTDATSTKENTFAHPPTAKYVRVRPVTYEAGLPTIRMEVYAYMGTTFSLYSR